VCSYLPAVVDASRAAEFPVTGIPAATVAVRAAGLQVQGRTVIVAGAVPATGERAVFCRPVVTASAVVRRDGTVLADAWLPDLVRLGELERHLGDGVIEAAVGEAVAAGRLKPRQRRRIMSYPLVIRLMIAMALMPDASYREALARVAGLLADIPFILEWHVPTGKVVTDWRLPVPAGVVEGIFWHAAGPLIGGGEPSAVVLAGMMVLAADGMLVNLADTPANRAMFGSTGTADDSAPFPQLRVVALTARAGRAMLGAILGSSSAGEQTLLKRLARRRPDPFAGRVTCFDRNSPAAHPQSARTAAALQARAESTPEIPARHRDQDDRHRETPGHRLRARLRLAACRDQDPSGSRNRPAMRGRGPWNRVPPRRDTRVPGMPQRHQETGIHARTEHNHLNTTGNLKRLKSVVLGAGRVWCLLVHGMGWVRVQAVGEGGVAAARARRDPARTTSFLARVMPV
jgi:hypothetical protein